MSEYTPGELMVAAAAREIRDGEVVFVGMRLPLLAFCLAKRTHAPRAVGLFESGVVRDAPSPSLLYTMCDPPNIVGAAACTPMLTVMALLQRGEVDVGFIGGAEIDRYGNVNTTCIGEPAAPTVRLPGSGGAADIAALAHRLVVIMEHKRHRFRSQVDYVTSPGFGDGPGWRERVGLRRGGPSALITTLGMFAFPSDTCEATLVSCHPGVSVDDVQAETQWPVAGADSLPTTLAPTLEELAVIREYDPEHFWTG